MDNIRVIRALQLGAALIFVFSLLQVFMMQLPMLGTAFAYSVHTGGSGIFGGLLGLVVGVAQALFMPLVLIALAEIIKLLRK